MQQIQIEWERLNLETNERLYALQRAYTLFNEIMLLQKRIETIIDDVELILNETNCSSNSFQQAKNHLNKLKVISNKKLFFFYFFFHLIAFQCI